jgi:hypothetical protein
MVARDGIEPPTPAFSGRLASEASGLESPDIIETISVASSSIYDGLGPFGMVSIVRWSCIGRAVLDQFRALDVFPGPTAILCSRFRPCLYEKN